MEEKTVTAFLRWVKQEKFSVFITFFAAILPPLCSFMVKIWGSEQLVTLRQYYFSGDKLIYITQCFFILLTLYFLFDYRSRILDDLELGKAHIIKYINKNCYRKLRRSKEGEDNYKIVRKSVHQFYSAWIIVWLIWLAYYLGNYLMLLPSKENYLGRTIYGHCFDFLSSTAMLFIYIILANVTVNIDKIRSNDDTRLWQGIFIWVFLFILWLVLLIMEGYYGNTSMGSDYQNLCALLLSIISSVVFVLVLGKMNSHYLYIPRPFMFIIYVYAIIQAYIPFQHITCIGVISSQILQFMIPFFTLIGKIFLMLTLCWVVNKKRLIFFVIHRSNALHMTKDLLAELDQEPVNF